ncbi:hypothetical protein DMUE_4767 [Dictyocoela muelleri]|nr:hypothetical protein DMUE_4767 [Dictyocoela muelleri]
MPCKFRIKKLKCKIPILINIIYFLINDSSYNIIKSYLNVSKNLITSIKSILRGCYAKYIAKRPLLLGGPGVVVDVDKLLFVERGKVALSQVSMMKSLKPNGF